MGEIKQKYIYGSEYSFIYTSLYTQDKLPLYFSLLFGLRSVQDNIETECDHFIFLLSIYLDAIDIKNVMVHGSKIIRLFCSLCLCKNQLKSHK